MNFTAGVAATPFDVTATGFPTPMITESGVLTEGRCVQKRRTERNALQEDRRGLPSDLHCEQRRGTPFTQPFTLTAAKGSGAKVRIAKTVTMALPRNALSRSAQTPLTLQKGSDRLVADPTDRSERSLLRAGQQARLVSGWPHLTKSALRGVIIQSPRATDARRNRTTRCGPKYLTRRPSANVIVKHLPVVRPRAQCLTSTSAISFKYNEVWRRNGE